MSLESFFNPKSVAIVGASRQKGKVGYEILTNMLDAGYEGSIYPVNPKAETIEGLKCYPDLKSIGDCPELVIIIIPARFVPDQIKQCASVGVKAVIIITAGFKEVGQDGNKLEQQIAGTPCRHVQTEKPTRSNTFFQHRSHRPQKGHVPPQMPSVGVKEYTGDL